MKGPGPKWIFINTAKHSILEPSISYNFIQKVNISNEKFIKIFTFQHFFFYILGMSRHPKVNFPKNAT